MFGFVTTLSKIKFPSYCLVHFSLEFHEDHQSYTEVPKLQDGGHVMYSTVVVSDTLCTHFGNLKCTQQGKGYC